MRKILSLISVIFLTLVINFGESDRFNIPVQRSILEPTVPVDSNSFSEVVPLVSVHTLIAKVDQGRVMTDLRRLSGEEPICFGQRCSTIVNRDTGSEGLQWAKEYIRQVIVGSGYTAEIQNWSNSGYSDQNIILKKRGLTLPGEKIYFVAHIDGVNADPLAPSPAADDNASGVVALLEMSRILKDYSFDRTIVLIFSTGEEHGALGMESYVAKLSTGERNAIKYVVDVDMIGYDSNSDGRMQIWSGDHPPSIIFSQTLSEIIDLYQLGLRPLVVTGCT